MVPPKRRAREGDPDRKPVTEAERVLMQQIVHEAIAHAMKATGITDADEHRRQHEDWSTIAPELKDTLIPYVRAKYEVAQKWSARLDKITDQFIMWAVGAVVLFILFCFYYGASSAMHHIVGLP